MTEVHVDERAVLELIESNGRVHSALVSIPLLSRTSEFFQAFFKHAQPAKPVFQDGLFLKSYSLHVMKNDVVFLKQLLKFAEGEPLQLTGKNVALALLMGDMWCMDEVLATVVAFLADYLSPVISSKVHKMRIKEDTVVLKIVQVFRLLANAAVYGVGIEQMTGIVELRSSCLEWMTKRFPQILLCPHFTSLAKETQQELITLCKQSLNPKNCIRLWDSYRVTLVTFATLLDVTRMVPQGKLSFSLKHQAQKIVSQELKNHAVCRILITLDDVFKAEEFDIFLRDGWNADVLRELMEDILHHLEPETSIHVYKALDTKVEVLTRQLVETRLRAANRQHASGLAKAEALGILERMRSYVLEYCQRHAMAVLRSDAYKSLSKDEQECIAESFDVGGTCRINANSDKQNHNSWAFIVMDNETSQGGTQHSRRSIA